MMNKINKTLKLFLLISFFYSAAVPEADSKRITYNEFYKKTVLFEKNGFMIKNSQEAAQVLHSLTLEDLNTAKKSLQEAERDFLVARNIKNRIIVRCSSGRQSFYTINIDDLIEIKGLETNTQLEEIKKKAKMEANNPLDITFKQSLIDYFCFKIFNPIDLIFLEIKHHKIRLDHILSEEIASNFTSTLDLNDDDYINEKLFKYFIKKFSSENQQDLQNSAIRSFFKYCLKQWTYLNKETQTFCLKEKNSEYSEYVKFTLEAWQNFLELPENENLMTKFKQETDLTDLFESGQNEIKREEIEARKNIISEIQRIAAEAIEARKNIISEIQRIAAEAIKAKEAMQKIQTAAIEAIKKLDNDSL